MKIIVNKIQHVGERGAKPYLSQEHQTKPKSVAYAYKVIPRHAQQSSETKGLNFSLCGYLCFMQAGKPQ